MIAEKLILQSTTEKTLLTQNDPDRNIQRKSPILEHYRNQMQDLWDSFHRTL